MKSVLPDVAMLRKMRTDVRMTQKELASRSGVAQSVISRIEDGKIHNPSYETVKRLLETLESKNQGKRGQVKTQDVMSRNVVSVKPQESIANVWRLMKDKDYSQLPVIDERGRILGGVTLGSIPDIIDDKTSHSYSVAQDIMTDPFPIVGKNTKVQTISAILQNEPAVLVVERGKVIGIITKYDLIENIYLRNPDYL